MNTQILQTLVNWNTISKQNFKFAYKNALNNKEKYNPVINESFLDNFFEKNVFFFAGFISAEFVLFLLNIITIRGSFIKLGIFAIILMTIHYFKVLRNNRNLSIQAAIAMTEYEKFEAVIERDLYNVKNFELYSADFKKFCETYYNNSSYYSNFIHNLFNHNLSSNQILDFFNFLEEYSKSNIANVELSSIKVKHAQSDKEDIQFFTK